MSLDLKKPNTWKNSFFSILEGFYLAMSLDLKCGPFESKNFFVNETQKKFKEKSEIFDLAFKKQLVKPLDYSGFERLGII